MLKPDSIKYLKVIRQNISWHKKIPKKIIKPIKPNNLGNLA